MAASAPVLLLLDCEASASHGDDELTAALLAALVAGEMTTGTGAALGVGFRVAVAGSPIRFFDDFDLTETHISRWQAEICRWLEARHAPVSVGAASAPPGAAVLAQLPAQRAYARVVLVTRYGSRSCTEDVLRPALEAFESQRPETPVELLCVVGGDAAPLMLPSALILLQGEFSLTVHTISDELAVGAWVSAYLACRHAVLMCLELGGGQGRADDEPRGEPPPQVRAWHARACTACMHTPRASPRVHGTRPACVHAGARLLGEPRRAARGAGVRRARVHLPRPAARRRPPPPGDVHGMLEHAPRACMHMGIQLTPARPRRRHRRRRSSRTAAARLAPRTLPPAERPPCAPSLGWCSTGAT